MNFMIAGIAALGVALALGAAPARADYVFSGFAVPGVLQNSIADIGNQGQLVGWAWDGTDQYGYLYDAGQLTRIDGPAGSIATLAIGVSDTNVVIGSWIDASNTWRSFVWADGSLLLTDLAIPGATSVYLRGISRDAHYLSGFYSTASSDGTGFIYDLTSHQLVAHIEHGSDMIIAHGINSQGQVAGSYQGSGGSSGFVYDLATQTRTDFSFAGVSARPRVINDQGQLAGFLFEGGRTKAWIGDTTSYQVLAEHPTSATYVTGINELGQVVGYFSDMTTGDFSYFVGTPVALPAAVGPDPHVHSFSVAVTADVPVFIDPLVAVGYAYAVGAGDPLFKTVSLPVGVGDNQFEIVVDGQRFAVSGHEVFDFTAHGFAGGVSTFTVEGIEPQAMLDPTNGQAFATRLTFASSGMFTGTQTALTFDYTPPIPEPASAWLLLAGLAAVAGRRRLVVATRSTTD